MEADAMHVVSFENQTHNRYTAVIDGVSIEFSRAMNKLAFGDCDALSTYVDELEQYLADGKLLAPLCSQMNGVNMLRLLEKLFREETIKNWLDFQSNHLEMQTRTAFPAFFGFRHNATAYPDGFGSELYEAARVKRLTLLGAEKKKEAAMLAEERRFNQRDKTIRRIISEIEKARTATREWIVERYPVTQNVVTYRINGNDFSMCLSGHTSLSSAKTVACYLQTLESGFKSRNRDYVKYVIHQFGGKAALSIIESFFRDEATAFFLRDMKRHVLSERVTPRPCAYLRSFFGGSSKLDTPFYLVLLTALEKSIPDLEKELVCTSPNEMYSKSDRWVLCYFKRRTMHRVIVPFPSLSPLKDEMKRFFISLYDQLSSSGEEPFQTIWKHANSIHRIVESINRPVSSALEISIWDYRGIITALSKDTCLESIRAHMFRMKKFVSFLDPEVAEQTIPASIIPPHDLNPRQPFDAAVIKKICAHSSELPEYIWLAFQLFAVTGARASAVFGLSTDDLMRLEEKWVIRLYYSKAAARKTESGTPSYVNHELPDELAQAIEAYINKTEHLRALLPGKALFVYESPWFRTGSSRAPRILDSDVFANALRKLCERNKIYNSDGMIPAWGSQGIRAEVGRSLFANGASADTVAAKLGNTAAVAKRHYDSMYPSDEATMRRSLYAQTIDTVVDSDDSEYGHSAVNNDPMYGSCVAHDACQHRNDCRNCTELIQQKQRGA